MFLQNLLGRKNFVNHRIEIGAAGIYTSRSLQGCEGNGGLRSRVADRSVVYLHLGEGELWV